MDNEYPRMLYRVPGPHDCGGIMAEYRIVKSADEEADLTIRENWHTTPTAASMALEVGTVIEPPLSSRAELLSRAEALGLKIDKRWNDDRIAGEIAAVRR